MLQYLKHNSGKILIGGQDITKINKDTLRKNISLVSQNSTLFNRSIKENILYGNDATNKLNETIKKICLEKLISQLPQGLESTIGSTGISISGGQKQRIHIARALLNKAPILILDEATANLDSQTENNISNNIQILLQERKQTLIVIAHKLSTLKNMDRIIVLDKGKIAEEGTHSSLIKNKESLYYKYYNIQSL